MLCEENNSSDVGDGPMEGLVFNGMNVTVVSHKKVGEWRPKSV